MGADIDGTGGGQGAVDFEDAGGDVRRAGVSIGAGEDGGSGAILIEYPYR